MSCPSFAAIFGLHFPLIPRIVESCLGDEGVEFNVFAQIQHTVQISKVLSYLCMLWESLRLGKIPNLWIVELINWKLRVDTGSRIAIPVPSPANVFSSSINFHRESTFPHIIQNTNPGNTRTHYKDVQNDLSQNYSEEVFHLLKKVNAIKA